MASNQKPGKQNDMGELEAENLRHGWADEPFNWEIPDKKGGNECVPCSLVRRAAV